MGTSRRRRRGADSVAFMDDMVVPRAGRDPRACAAGACYGSGDMRMGHARRMGHGRWMGSVIVTVCLGAAMVGLWRGVAGQGSEPAEASEGLSIEGRYGVISEAGGAVWAFLPGGQLTLVGPGDLVAAGTWLPATAVGAFDATVDIGLTGQTLTVLGALAPDGQRVALHVGASRPLSPENGVPWPAVSRLIGERIGMVQVGPSPTPAAEDCQRPAWESGSVVDWDPCAAGPTATLLPSIARARARARGHGPTARPTGTPEATLPSLPCGRHQGRLMERCQPA